MTIPHGGLQAAFVETNRRGLMEEMQEEKLGRLVVVRRWLKNHKHQTARAQSRGYPPATDTELLDTTNSRIDPDTKNVIFTEAAVVLQSKQHPSPQRQSKSAQPPPSALKTKPRIPLELQAVFLESNRNGIVDKPAPKSASKIFGIRWTLKKKAACFAAPAEVVGDVSEEGDLDSSVSSYDSSSGSYDSSPEIGTTTTPHPRRRLNFGPNETFLFEKRHPTTVRYNNNIHTNTNHHHTASYRTRVPPAVPTPTATPSRWSSGLDEKEASLATMPRPMPRRHSPRY